MSNFQKVRLHINRIHDNILIGRGIRVTHSYCVRKVMLRLFIVESSVIFRQVVAIFDLKKKIRKGTISREKDFN